MTPGRRSHPPLPRRVARWALTAALLPLAAAVILPAAAPGAAAGTLTVTPAAPVQGDTLAIVVHAAPGSKITVRFGGASLPVFVVGEGTWRALRGTDPDTPPASYVVTAKIIPPNRAAVSLLQTVRVARKQFAERHLTLSPGTMGLITPKNLAIERDALDSVLGRRTPEALWRGPFVAPVEGPMDSPYGYQGFYNGVREWWHQGVDFDVPAGAPVTAPNAGIVVLARALPLGGNTVVLDHGQGVLTEYLHLSAFTVQAGQRVAQGDLIARIGATGLVTGPGLHWGLYADGHWVNPLFWMTSRPGLTD